MPARGPKRLEESPASQTGATIREETGSRLVGYARVSTADQRLDLQINALREAGVATVHKEVVSGVVRNRPELARALAGLQSGDTFVVWRLDRLGRTVAQLSAMLESFRERGIQFRSLTESIDTSTPMGRAMFHIISALAEMERSALQDRIRAGIDAKKQRGERTGRKPVMLPETVKLAVKLLDEEGRSYNSVARDLKVSPSALYKHVAKARADGLAASRKPSRAKPGGSSNPPKKSESMRECVP